MTLAAGAHDAETTVRLALDTVADFLASHGLDVGSDMRVEALGGGVSADIYAVESSNGAWVVKQSLPQLRVQQDWWAGPERALTEAHALRLAAALVPEAVPPLVLADDATFTLVLGRAPAALGNWKATLLREGGVPSRSTATALGRLLAVWHSATTHHEGLTERFGDTEAFVQLRVDPFYRAAAQTHPDLADVLEDLAQELLTRPRCLVHGDFSPKNILADGPRVWVLDWEVAHLGNPAFDLSFLIAHLVCKALHQPGYATSYRLCAEDFLAAYSALTRTLLPGAAADLTSHVAALVLARVDGKSPVEYFDEPTRERARLLARAWLLNPPATLTELWEHVS